MDKKKGREKRMIYASQGRREILWSKTEHMPESENFETFYARKLDALKVQLQNLLGLA